MDFKTQMIEYLEKKIKGCEELEMDSEKWAFIQCLLEVRKLCEGKKDNTRIDSVEVCNCENPTFRLTQKGIKCFCCEGLKKQT